MKNRGKVIEELGKRRKSVKRQGELIVGVGGGRNTVLASKSTKLLHSLLECIEDYRIVEVESADRFSAEEMELSNGNTIRNTDYIETWYKVTVYLKRFVVFGKEFNLKYTYNTDFRQVIFDDLPLRYFLNGKEVTCQEFYKDQENRRKYHIKNDEVSKEEYEHYLKSKEKGQDVN